MIESVNKYPISSLMDIERQVIYAIPRYQREYTWGRAQWDALFEDLLDNESNYFLGSIICINQAQDALAVQELELVDGQQRMTTLSLLLIAIYQSLRIQPNLQMDHKIELYNLKHKLVLKKQPDQPRLIPQVQNHNQQDFYSVFEMAGILKDVDTVPNAGNRRVLKAYRHFLARIEHYIEGSSDVITCLMTLLEKVNTATLVKIEVAGHSDAYTLFESLNNRGVPLTAIDLIKNKLLASLEAKDKGSIDKHYNRWKRVMDALGDDYAIQERFFRQYYNAFKPDLKAIVSVPVATKSNLMFIYEKLISHDAEAFLSDMIRMSSLYAQIISAREVTGYPKLTELLLSLERIQGAAAYLLLMVLFDLQNEDIHGSNLRSQRESLALDEGHLVEIVDFLLAFFVRRNTTDLPPTRDLTRIFMDLAEQVLSLKGSEVVKKVREVLTLQSASDEQFRRSLKGPIYEENKAVCRFILCALEEEHMTRETQVDLWALKGKQYLWTIEHIFPQGENIPTEWVNMIAGGDAIKAEEYRQTHAHCLGNLTISGYNSTLGNKSFADKKNRTDSQGRKVGYNNGLYLNRPLVEHDRWTIEKLEKRTNDLVEKVMTKYSLTV